MKGLIVFTLCLLTLGAEASMENLPKRISTIKTHDGKIISNLSLQESTKVLISLKADENIELRNDIIYPEEVSEVIASKLTKFLITEKRPNPNDYN